MPKLHHPIGQKPQAPALPALRRIRARESDQVSLGSPIQDPPPRLAGLLGHERHLQTILAKAPALKAPALARHRGGGNLQYLRDPLIGPAVHSIGIGFEQDASVEQLAGVRPAAANERRCSRLRSSSVRRTKYFLFMARTPVLLMPMRVQHHALLLNLSVTEN